MRSSAVLVCACAVRILRGGARMYSTVRAALQYYTCAAAIYASRARRRRQRKYAAATCYSTPVGAPDTQGSAPVVGLLLLL